MAAKKVTRVNWMLKHTHKRVNCRFIILPLDFFGADLVGSLVDLAGAMMAILCLVTNKLIFFLLSFS